jgi:hypothetical protein
MPGVTVNLYAWPSNSVLRAMKVGQAVPVTLLATAVTNSAGKYVLRVPVAKLMAAAVESGYANLEISSAVAGFWFLPYQTDSLPAHPAAPVSVNLNSAKKPQCGGPVEGNPLSSTGFVLQRQLKPAWAVVGQGYIAPQKGTAGDTTQFSYVRQMSQSQTSTLGIGISGYGLDAGYNSSGTSASTATEGVTYPSEPKSTWFRTEFSVGRFRSLCVASPDAPPIPHKKQHGKCPRTYTDSIGNPEQVYKCLWMVHSTGWFGPSGSVVHPEQVPSTPSRFCGQVGSGFKVQTNRQKAIRWSAGFEIGASDGIKGVDLKANFGGSAETGYDANAQMTFTFKHAGWICGTDAKPKNAALLVVRGSKT